MLVLDCETTGTDTQRDQIVELCIMTDGVTRSRRFRPTVPIPAEATAVHGISDADVATCPAFSACARSVRDRLAAAAMIVGYGVRFDLEILQAELARCGLPPLDLTRVVLLDALRLWQHFEPRTLAAAHAKFTGSPLDGAHSAEVDVKATASVIEAMRQQFSPGATWTDLAALADPIPGRSTWVGPSQHIRRDGDRIVFGFGKHEGQSVDCVDRGYLRWIQGQEFPKHVKAICAMAADPTLTTAQFLEWMRTNHPPRGE